jgi:Ricin-type beta-trefoil lectin domain
MKTLNRVFFSFAATAAFCLPLSAQAEMFTSAGSPGYCLANAGGTPVAQGCVKSATNQSISMPYRAGENVFYGQLNIGGQCLDVSGATLKFAACKPGDAQIWKMTGNTGLISNGQGNCVSASGGSVSTVPCSRGGKGLTWWNLGAGKVKIIAVTMQKTVAPGTVLKVSGDKLIANDGSSVVAAGAGNIVAGGAGNIVAGGAGNIVAGGAGN